ncbi:MAG TPA: GxxExxY protein [Candidatus Methylacidiphilales bacterium]|jgi:GxxExxY protein|nr:GxxExxY protein [Candidatus Methylacidiphilales bacterium]
MQNDTDQQLAKRIIGLAMDVYNNLGCGLLESLYVGGLIVELKEARIPYERQKRFTVTYRNMEIGCYIADLVIDNRLIVEAKAVDSLAIAHSVQLVNYLAISKIDLGLLLNFGPRKLEFKTKTRLHPGMPEPPNLQQ